MPITSGDIQNIYGQYGLGSPSQGNINSFLQYSNNGSVPLTSFDIGQILQGTPQYQQNLMNQFGSQLQNVLGGSDQRLLGIAGNQIQQQFAQQGRNIGSSGYLNAYMGAAQNLATARQQQLANFYAPNMQNQMGLAAGQANQAQQFGMGQQASTLGFQRQMALYQQQQSDYQNWVNSQNRNWTGIGKGAAAQAIGSFMPNFGSSVFSGGGFGGVGGGGGLGGGMYGNQQLAGLGGSNMGGYNFGGLGSGSMMSAFG